MKERIINSETLTNSHPKPYSKYGDIFMAEKGDTQNPPENSRGLIGKKELRDQWGKALAGGDLKNSDTRSTVEMAINLGIAPQEIAPRGNKKTEVKEARVIANALLADKERIEKAEELLGKKLSETQKTALLKAHYEGEGEIGKDGSQAGVYNYTERQLSRKAKILRDECGFDNSQRRMVIEAGLAATPIPNVANYADPTLQNVIQQYNAEVNRINRINPSQHVDPNFLARQMNRIEKLADDGRVDATQANNLLSELQTIFVSENPPRSGVREGMWFKLRPADMDMLDQPSAKDGVLKWMNLQFDAIYEASKGKDPLKSPVTGEISAVYAEAVRYLQLNGRLDRLGEISDLWDTRINLMKMASVVGGKNLEQVHQAAGELTSRGLLFGFTVDERRVGSMFNSLAELVEDKRIDKREIFGHGGRRQHVSPELLQYVQEKAISEQVNLAAAGVGIFADFYRDAGGGDVGRKAVEIEVTRSMRTAYDILVSSQRVAVIAARGKNLLATDAFFSDPGSTFSMFNFEAYTTDKWSSFNTQDEKFLQPIRDEMVRDYLEEHKDQGVLTDEEKMDLGRRLLRDLGVVPDFFSSGWRIKGITDQLEKYFVYKKAMVVNNIALPNTLSQAEMKEKIDALPPIDPNNPNDLNNFRVQAKLQAENFGLFLRLKAADTRPKKEAVWKKIKQFKPEEIIKLFHERASDEDKRAMNRVIFAPYGLGNYDLFKEKYGAVIRALREEGFRADPPTQIDFSHLTNSQKNTINAVHLGEADVVVNIFNAMKQHIDNSGAINNLLSDQRFVDIYGRTLNVDDALLDRVENPPENSGMIPVSKMWGGAEVGNDALVRNMNDIVNAKKGYDALIGFVKAEGEEEKLKQAKTAAAAIAEYNGRAAEAKVLRYTFVKFLELSMIPPLFDALGIAKLPFRIPMTEIEKIYGPSAKPLSQADRRIMMDKLKALLSGSVANRRQEIQEGLLKEKEAIDLDPTLTPEARDAKKKIAEGAAGEKMYKAEEEAEKMYKRAEGTTRTSGKARLGQKGLDLLITVLIWALDEGIRATGMSELGKGK